MSELIWRFDQRDFIAKHKLKGQEDGVCLALATRWAKMRLKNQGTELTQDDKSAYFEKGPRGPKQSVPDVIGLMQKRYDDIRAPAQKKVKRIAAIKEDAINSVLYNPDGTMTDAEYDSISDACNQLASLEGSKVANALHSLFRRQNLRVVAEKNCNAFQDWFQGVEDGHAYLYDCNDLKHAFGGYYTKGWVWGDYYLFDPNCGTYHLDGAGEMITAMGALRREFNVVGRATRYDLAYISR